MPDFEIVRDDDPRCAVLEQAGYRVVGESWAARLRDPDRALLDAAVLRVAAAGFSVRQLGEEFAEALFELETANGDDYPYTPATQPPSPPTAPSATPSPNAGGPTPPRLQRRIAPRRATADVRTVPLRPG